jgi:hypothetical protein
MTWRDPEPRWDTQIEIVELPRIFRTTLDAIPDKIPYVYAPEMQLRLGSGKLHVGIVWIAGAYNPARSIAVHLLRPLFDVPGCEFFSLQAGPERSELMELSSRVHDVYDPDECVFDAAGKLVNLDLLITVDTMMAHLGGALGVPVWTLLPFEADWRWMLDRDDSPWYPTMRLFRQLRQGDWSSPIARVCAELTEAVAQAA